jgi:hypothetical protein
MATGRSRTVGPTASGAASTTSCPCCTASAATWTSRFRRRPTRVSPTRSTRSTGPRAISTRLAATNTGPLALARKGLGLRIENGAITGDDPPTAARVATWIDQAIHIEGRPEWIFVKVHTHGSLEKTAASLLGDGGRALHTALREQTIARGDKLHYVTAREMFNVARAAMDGRTGDPDAYFDYIVKPPPIALARSSAA